MTGDTRVRLLTWGLVLGCVALIADRFPLDPPLAVSLAFVYGWLAHLVVEHRDAVPTVDDWRTDRWNGLFVAVVVVGTAPLLRGPYGLPGRQGLAVGALAIGVAAASFLCGVVLVDAARSERGESEPGAVRTGESG
ncbi:MAG: hypothetical protein ABEJ94_00785 [Halorientalis sp.]